MSTSFPTLLKVWIDCEDEVDRWDPDVNQRPHREPVQETQ